MRKLIPDPSAHTGTAQVIAGALLLVALAGVLASWALWPDEPAPPVLPVQELRYFTAAFIAEAEAFRGLQSWLSIAVLALGVLVPLLGAMVVVRTGISTQGRRSPALAASGVIVLIVALTLVAQLPLRIAMHRRAGEVGLSVQSTGSWLLDWSLSAVITLVSAFLLALLCIGLVRRLRRAWWVGFWAALVVLVSAWQLASPVVIEPLFADFTRVEQGELLRDVERVAARSRVDAGDVFVVNSSSRTTGVNAYVSGIGVTKRVVLYDTLTNGPLREQRLATIAHEFGHARHHDLIKGLLWFAFVAFFSLFAIDRVVRRLLAAGGAPGGSPQTLAVILAAIALCFLINQPAANALSRAVEARADAFAIEVTERPEVAIELERTLTIRNVARPDPPAGLHWFFGSHPTPVERIGMAEGMRRQSSSGDSLPGSSPSYSGKLRMPSLVVHLE